MLLSPFCSRLTPLMMTFNNDNGRWYSWKLFKIKGFGEDGCRSSYFHGIALYVSFQSTWSKMVQRYDFICAERGGGSAKNNLCHKKVPPANPKYKLQRALLVVVIILVSSWLCWYSYVACSCMKSRANAIFYLIFTSINIQIIQKISVAEFFTWSRKQLEVCE